MSLYKSSVNCLVCFNSTYNNAFVSSDKSQKIFSVCYSHVKDAINVEFLIENIRKNNNKQLVFCKNCLDSSLNLSQLVEELHQLKTKIADLSEKFSKAIAQRRCKEIANKAVDTTTISENKAPRQFNKQTINEEKRSLIQDSLTSNDQSLEISNQIAVENNPNDIEVIDVDVMQNETPERDDLFTNLFSNEERNNFDTEDHTTEKIGNKNSDSQPNVFGVDFAIVNTEDNMNYYSQYTNSNPQPLLDDVRANIAVESIVDDLQSQICNVSQSVVQNQIGRNIMTPTFPCSSSSAIGSPFISKIIAKQKGKNTRPKANYKNVKTSSNKLNSKRQQQNKTHGRRHSTQVAKRYSCDQCATVFSIRESFMKHRRIAHGYIPQIKPYSYFCRVGHCGGKSFRQVQRRDRHEDFCQRHFRVKHDSSLK